MESVPQSKSDGELKWWHFTFSTYGVWVPGDERGFRNHDHRIHSSGDYKSPPPAWEHAGLRRWNREHMHKPAVRLPETLRSRVGAELVRKFLEQGVELLAVAVAPEHVHGLARLTVDRATTVVGNAKRAASHKVRAWIPGAVWGKRANFRSIRDVDHHRNTFSYIVDHRNEGAWVWTFRDPVPIG